MTRSNPRTLNPATSFRNPRRSEKKNPSINCMPPGAEHPARVAVHGTPASPTPSASHRPRSANFHPDDLRESPSTERQLPPSIAQLCSAIPARLDLETSVVTIDSAVPGPASTPRRSRGRGKVPQEQESSVAPAAHPLASRPSTA
jgi:hypothetical protein